MKNWTQTLIIGFAGISLAFAACGDDDNGTTTDTTQPPADTMTADTTAADTNIPAATDQCTNTEDGAVIQADPDAPGAIATGCGVGSSCIGFAFSDLEQFETCVQGCMTDDTTGAGLTDGCSLCYTQIVVCTAENCLAAPANCASAPNGEACVECRNTNCGAAFAACSGLQ